MYNIVRMPFDCKRCGYRCEKKHHYIAHIKRVNLCPATVADISRDDLLKEYPKYIDKKPKVYNCKHCNKAFNLAPSLYRHQKTCKEGGNAETIELKRNIKNLKIENELLKMRSVTDSQSDELNDIESKIDPLANGYIYIIWTREFVNSNKAIYKIGRTRDIHKRLHQYPKHSKLLYCVFTTDIIDKETQLIEILKNKDSGVDQQLEYGTEYFLGDYTILKSHIEKIV